MKAGTYETILDAIDEAEMKLHYGLIDIDEFAEMVEHEMTGFRLLKVARKYAERTPNSTSQRLGR